MVLLPDDKLGIAILTNSWRTSVFLNLALAERISDCYLHLSTRDYAAEYRESWEKSEEQDVVQERALESARLKNTTPTLPLSAYAGEYRDNSSSRFKSQWKTTSWSCDTVEESRRI